MLPCYMLHFLQVFVLSTARDITEKIIEVGAAVMVALMCMHLLTPSKVVSLPCIIVYLVYGWHSSNCLFWNQCLFGYVILLVCMLYNIMALWE